MTRRPCQVVPEDRRRWRARRFVLARIALVALGPEQTAAASVSIGHIAVVTDRFI